MVKCYQFFLNWFTSRFFCAQIIAVSRSVKDEIIKQVKKARFVKDNTILVNLNDSRYFKRLKDGRYAAA